MRKGIKSGS